MVAISIVVPLYNKIEYIIKALLSILEQNYENYEVIIINDGSTDGGGDLVLEWISSLNDSDKEKFTIYSQVNSGVSCARNNGVKYAKYAYVAFLDGDDYWKEGHLHELAKLVDKYSSSVDIFSSYSIQVLNDKYIYPKLGRYNDFIGIVDYFKVSIISNGFVNSSSVCVKRESILKNNFPCDMKNFEDVVTWAVVSSDKGMAFSSKPTSVYVVDNAEGSSCIDFENYLRFEVKLVDGLKFDRFTLFVFLFKFIFIHVLFARMTMSLHQYLKSSKSVFGKSLIVSVCIALAFFIPRTLLLKMRNYRKR